MSEENVEGMRLGLEGWRQDGYRPDFFGTDAFDTELEWDISAHPLPDWPNTGSGRANFQRHMASYVSGWRNYRAHVQELIDGGDEVVVVLHETVSMRDSDGVLERDLHAVWTIRDGVAVRFRVFKTRDEALEAAGLSE